MPIRGERIAFAFVPMEVHSGPIFYDRYWTCMEMREIVKSGPHFYDKGTLTKRDKDAIFVQTKVVANIRARRQWQWKRGLTS